MALQLRRGTNGQRLTITPAEGELVYTTDTKLVYVGDGSTLGGNALGSSGSGPGTNSFTIISVAGQDNVVADQAIDTLTLSAGTGISITTNNVTDTITLTNSGVTSALAGTGINISNSTGAVTINTSALLNVLEDTSPQLGGTLDLNNYSISSPNDMTLVTNNGLGTGVIYLRGILSTVGGMILAPRSTTNDNINNPAVTQIGDVTNGYDGNLIIARNTYSNNANAGFTFSQYHETPDAVNFIFFRSRGSRDSRQAVISGDEIADLGFITFDGTNPVPAANICVKIDGTVSSGRAPGKIEFFVHDGITSGVPGLKLRAEIKPDGRFNIDTLAGLNTNNVTMPTNNSLTIGDVRLDQNGLSTVNSNAPLSLSANGTGTVNVTSNLSVTGSVTLTDVLNMPVLNTAPLTPIAGMIAISSGLGWDPLSDGQQHMMVYLNGGWVSAA